MGRYLHRVWAWCFCAALSIVFAPDAHPQTAAPPPPKTAKLIGIPMGPGNLYPSVQVKGVYDDNLLRRNNNRVKTFGVLLVPDAIYEIRDNIKRFDAEWQMNAGDYFSSHRDDYVDNAVTLDFQYDPTDRVHAALMGKFQSSHDPRGTGRGEAIAVLLEPKPDRWHAFSVEADGRYGAETARAQIEGAVGYLAKKYDNNRIFTYVRDRKDFYSRLTGYLRVAPKTRLLVEGRATNYAYDHNAPNSPSLDSNVYRALAGVTWQATFKTTGYIKGGWIWKNFNASGRSDASDGDWEVGVKWKPRSYSEVDISSSRDLQETNGAGDFIRADNYITASWTYAWLPRVRTVVNAAYTRYSYDPSPRHDDFTTAGARIEYDFRHWLTLSAGYDYERRNSNDNIFDYTRNVAEVTFNFSL